MTNKPKVELHLGDCMEFMKSMPDKSVDAILTDLPYGTTACSWDEIIPFEPMWEQVKRICKGVFVTTASQPFTSKLVMSNLKGFRYEWIYKKIAGSNFVTCKYQPMKEHENVLVFGEQTPPYYPIMQERNGSGSERIKYPHNPSNTGKRAFVGGLEAKETAHGKKLRYPSSVQTFNNRLTDDRGLHPTQKPVALYEYLTRTYTNKGDTVLDFVMGSGTTGVACVQTGRNFIGCEIDPTYFAIAERRIAEAQLQERLDFDD